jgi:hypothetical protein
VALADFGIDGDPPLERDRIFHSGFQDANPPRQAGARGREPGAILLLQVNVGDRGRRLQVARADDDRIVTP